MKNKTKRALRQNRTTAIMQQAKTRAAQWDEERETLTLQITAAFFDTELGDGIGFYEANAIDDYMSGEERYAVANTTSACFGNATLLHRSAFPAATDTPPPFPPVPR